MAIETCDALPAPTPPRVLFLIRSLNRGGAERQLVALACGLHARGWPVVVACFYDGGPFEGDLRDAGVPVFDLAKRGRWDLVGFLFRLWKLLRQQRPAILLGYLPTPNLLALSMRWTVPHMRIVWGVRASNMDLDRYDWLSAWQYWLERHTARFADLVIANSRAGARLRVAQGFPRRTMHVIPNGIDADRYRYDPAGRQRVRGGWGVADQDVLVGLVGRLDPMKDHPTFLRAAAALAKRGARWRFVCVGEGPADYTLAMKDLCKQLGLSGHVIWPGARDDMPAVYSAIDIASSSSSFGEGFPNVVAEAMACGRPCVVTDVGDSALIVGDLGIAVPPGQPSALADAIERAWQWNHKAQGSLGDVISQRIAGQYSVESLVSRTADLLQQLYGNTGRTSRPRS